MGEAEVRDGTELPGWFPAVPPSDNGSSQGKCPDKPALWAQQESSLVGKGNTDGLNLPGREGMGEAVCAESRALG